MRRRSHTLGTLALFTTLAAAALGGGCGEGTARLEARILAPRALAEQAQSVVIYVIDGLRVDGSPLACSALLDGDVSPFSSELYLLSSSVVNVDAGTAEVTIDGVPVGEARVSFVEVYDRPDGLNRVIAAGCTARVDVTPEAPAEVDVELQPRE